MNNKDTRLYLANQKTFKEFPRNTSVEIHQDDVPVQFGTVIGHKLNDLGEMVLQIVVVGTLNGGSVISVHPKNRVTSVVKLS